MALQINTDILWYVGVKINDQQIISGEITWEVNWFHNENIKETENDEK